MKAVIQIRITVEKKINIFRRKKSLLNLIRSIFVTLNRITTITYYYFTLQNKHLYISSIKINEIKCVKIIDYIFLNCKSTLIRKPLNKDNLPR